MRRGACPTLAQPMQTGDGLLARLAPAQGRLTPGELGEIAQAAERFGNGIMEITARGKLQIRGLTEESAPLFSAHVAALDLGVSDGFDVETSPLAGLAADEIADPRGLVQEISAKVIEFNLAESLGPKVSVTVDGGGMLHLAQISADIKLEALPGGQWRIGIGGNSASARWLGHGDAATAIHSSIALLRLLAEKGPDARARQFEDNEVVALKAGLNPCSSDHSGIRPLPIGRFILRGGGDALGFALPFGQIPATCLADFAETTGKADEIRLAPGGGLLVLGLPRDHEAALYHAAERPGFIAERTDPRLSITACAGAPSCANALLDTKTLAADVAASGLIDGSLRLHLSGCAKRCAAPGDAQVTLIGTEGGSTLETGKVVLSKTLTDFLTRHGTAHRATHS